MPDALKIGSIVIRCCEFDRMQAFWQAALRYVPRESASDAGSCFAIRRARARTFRRNACPSRALAGAAGCTWTCARATASWKSNAC